MFARLGWLVLALYIFATPAFAVQKIALLIGNAEYSGGAARLKNPVNDVEAMKTVLAGAGFKVFSFTNLTRVGMSKALRDFEAAASKADIGLVFYSGHGIEIGGVNYLVPVDAQLETERDAKYEAIDLEDVLAALSNTKLLKLVLLDACRDNPFLKTMKGSTKGSRSKGLARIEGLDEETNLLIGYATAPKETAQDGNGRNSPFTQALIQHLVEPGVEVQTAFRAVAKAVYRETKGEQRPYSTGSLFETVLLGPEKTTHDTSSTSPSAEDLCGQALAHWESIKDRKSAPLFEEHLKRFGSCAFSSIARLELEALEQSASGTAADEDTTNNSQRTEIAAIPTMTATDEQKPELYRSLQTELGRVGCYNQTVDGDWGPASEHALLSFNIQTKNAFDPKQPTLVMLNTIKALNGRICPLTCSLKEKLVEEQCLPKTCESGKQLNDKGRCTSIGKSKDRIAKQKDKAEADRPNCFTFNGEQMCE